MNDFHDGSLDIGAPPTAARIRPKRFDGLVNGLRAGFAMLVGVMVISLPVGMIFPFARHVSERGHGHPDWFRFSKLN
jgi:hypothetical protein